MAACALTTLMNVAAAMTTASCVNCFIAQSSFSMLAGPHPRSLSLGGATAPRSPPAPRSGRWRFGARGAPHLSVRLGPHPQAPAAHAFALAAAQACRSLSSLDDARNDPERVEGRS